MDISGMRMGRPVLKTFSPRNMGMAGGFARGGLIGSMGLIGLSKANQTIQAASHGQYGNALINAGLAAGAGSLAYHAIMRTPSYGNAIDAGVNLIRRNANGNNPLLNRVMNKGFTSFLRGMR